MIDLNRYARFFWELTHIQTVRALRIRYVLLNCFQEPIYTGEITVKDFSRYPVASISKDTDTIQIVAIKVAYSWGGVEDYDAFSFPWIYPVIVDRREEREERRQSRAEAFASSLSDQLLSEQELKAKYDRIRREAEEEKPVTDPELIRNGKILGCIMFFTAPFIILLAAFMDLF